MHAYVSPHVKTSVGWFCLFMCVLSNSWKITLFQRINWWLETLDRYNGRVDFFLLSYSVCGWALWPIVYSRLNWDDFWIPIKIHFWMEHVWFISAVCQNYCVNWLCMFALCFLLAFHVIQWFFVIFELLKWTIFLIDPKINCWIVHRIYRLIGYLFVSN